MLNPKIKLPLLDRRIKKLIGVVGSAGIITLISLPLLAQLYPPYALFQPYANPNYPYRNEEGNVVDTLNQESNFVNLRAELEEAGLTETLKAEKFTTILAPTDAAFEALSDEIFTKFSQPDNRIKVLQYHLILGEVTKEDVDRGEIKTLEGNFIAISKNHGVVTVNDANAKHPSILASNGVIIEIDKVLLPPDF